MMFRIFLFIFTFSLIYQFYSIIKMQPGIFKHIRCRGIFNYPKSEVLRFSVPDDKVFWDIPYPNYKPPFYESNSIKEKDWADLEIGNPNFKPKWNALDGQINRKSYNGIYQIDEEGYPLNTFGRTGIRGRGLLGRWGPNFAADPIVTRFKLDASGNPLVNQHSGKNILQMCAIERHDCHEWALPGGMVDPGEMVSQTLKREFMEEAMSSSESTEELEKFFDNGQEIYKGYVDDPRNTDNSWMETVAMNFHDESGNIVGKFKLEAGDDARKVKWMDINSEVKLYASHLEIVKKAVECLNAHW